MTLPAVRREPRVLHVPFAPAEVAHHHFAHLLAMETDPSDVAADLDLLGEMFVLVDARSRAKYLRGHLPGAVNLPWRDIGASSTRTLDPLLPVVVYCTGPGCNSAAKAAVRLAALGFQVKEMRGGMDAWLREGRPVVHGPAPGRAKTMREAPDGAAASMVSGANGTAPPACGC